MEEDTFLSIFFIYSLRFFQFLFSRLLLLLHTNEGLMYQTRGGCWWGGEKPPFSPLLLWAAKESRAVEMWWRCCRRRVGVCWEVEEEESTRNLPSGTTAHVSERSRAAGPPPRSHAGVVVGLGSLQPRGSVKCD